MSRQHRTFISELLEDRRMMVDQSPAPILQWFEASYDTIERRVADAFLAGYGAVWAPPPSRADISDFSVGYDVYDRYDLGRPGRPTLYGTESGITTLAKELDKGSLDFHVDFVMNHNGYSGTGDAASRAAFIQSGGYPGFFSEFFGDVDGDFNSAYSYGDVQGRLAGLIDIDHSKNYRAVRTPVPGFANNIAAGTVPDGAGRLANVALETNRRFYPDIGNHTIYVFDPVTGEQNIPVHQFNLENPMAGDPVEENALGYLMRYAQWLVQYVGVDGLRIDAAKHVDGFVLDFIDRAIYRSNPRSLLDGSPKHTFAYSEVYDANPAVLLPHVKKTINPNDPGRIGGNRDTLDFKLYFALKENLEHVGTGGAWYNIRNAALDFSDDGLHNGSAGVMFVNNHDVYKPYELDNVAHAYVLMHPGNAAVYFNGKEFGDNRDFPKEGRSDALSVGNGGSPVTRLVNIRNTHGRGNYAERWIDNEGIFVYERVSSAVIGLSNRGDGGYDTRYVEVGFAPGTHLVELTGNAANSFVDPYNNIPEVVTVFHDNFDGKNKIEIKVPRNRNANGDFHGLGYVVYGLAGPQSQAGLEISNVAQVLAGDTTPTSNYENGRNRQSSVKVIQDDSFEVRLLTNEVRLLGSDSLRDIYADGDNAMLKFDGGIDINGNGHVDVVTPGSVAYGFEQFGTKSSPLIGFGGLGAPRGDGEFRQIVNATQLSEGYHYLEARGFRHRTDGGPEIFSEWKDVIYVDRLPPNSGVDSFTPFTPGVNENRDLTIRSLDKTADSVHVMLDLPASLTDEQIISMANGGNKAGKVDRDLFKYGYFNVTNGNHVATIVTYEQTGNVNVQRVPGLYTQSIIGAGLGDLDFDGQFEVDDVNQFAGLLASNNTQFNAAADLNSDGVIDNGDLSLLVNTYVAASAPTATIEAAQDLVSTLTTATIGNLVWNDTNRDGLLNGGEGGIANVAVMLLNASGSTIATAATDANGNYQFAELTPGTYSVQFVAPAGLVFSAKDQGGNEATDSDADPLTGRTASFSVIAGQANLDIDAALHSRSMNVSAPVILQWFESSWNTIENRLPDYFNAGYGAIWTPPPGRGIDTPEGGNLGYDVYDRFDLGKPGDSTLYGTEAGYKTLIDLLHRTGGDVYVDFLHNHVGSYDVFPGNSPGPYMNSIYDYPGFVLSHPGTSDGDTHPDPPPAAPGTEDYEYQFRLARLVDLDHRTNNNFIRSPVNAGDPLNIPTSGAANGIGRIANLPDPNNARFYPDVSLPGITIDDPALGQFGITVHPFNLANPLAGDAVPENAMGYLMRYAQWLVQYVGVDGLRIDAARHVYPFVREYIDRAVYGASLRENLDGSKRNVFSFQESFTGDRSALQSFIRKDINPATPNVVGGNRDVLDFPLWFAMKDNLTANGFDNNWYEIRNASQDFVDDGLANNGSQALAFVINHDDGGVPLSNVAHAYTLMRPGNAVVYFNAREFNADATDPNERPFPDPGRGDALGGLYGDTVTTLVDIRNTHGRGDFVERWLDDFGNPNAFSNIYVYERLNSAIVGLNSRMDGGFDQRDGIQTGFAPGTLLVELTGNASDPAIDPNGDIPEVITVGADGKINLRIPRNKNINTGENHNSGYVIYGVAGPQGTMSLSNVDQVLAGGVANEQTNDTTRLADVRVIKQDSFNVTLATNAVNLLGNPALRDQDADGSAAYLKLDGGLDLNGNGQVDFVTPGSTVYGFETFVGVNQPGASQASGNGLYQQSIDATQLAEGYHFLETRAFRERAAGDPEVFTSFRDTIYIDRLAPVSAVESFKPLVEGVEQNRRLVVRSLDKTADSVHVLFDLPGNLSDAQILALVNGSNRAQGIDRDLFALDANGLSLGAHVATVVTFEPSGTSNIQRFTLAVGEGATVGNRVWLDTNGDSLQTGGESGVGNVTVRLLTPTAQVVQSTTTAADGSYNFTAVAAGDYLIEFVLPTGMAFVQANRRANDTIDSDADVFSGRTVTFAVAEDALIDHVDAGLRTPLEFPWHNPAPDQGLNVDDSPDGVVPQDLLFLLDDLRRRGYRDLPTPTPGNSPPIYYFDTVANNKFLADDILAVLDEINRRAQQNGLLSFREDSGDSTAADLAVGIALVGAPRMEINRNGHFGASPAPLRIEANSPAEARRAREQVFADKAAEFDLFVIDLDDESADEPDTSDAFERIST